MDTTFFTTDHFFGALAGVITLAGGYILKMVLDRRKWNAENAAAELDADTKAVELYERYVATLKPELDALKEKYAELNKTVDGLKQENLELKADNKRLSNENTRLQVEISDLQTEVDELRKQIPAKTKSPRKKPTP